MSTVVPRLPTREKKRFLLDRVAARIGDLASKEDPSIAGIFVRQCYRDAAFEDLAGSGVEGLAGAAQALLELARQRLPGKPELRIWNPGDSDAAWGNDHTVIQIANDDMPFLVDSVVGELNRSELTVHLMVHPVIVARRDPRGRLLELVEGDAESAGGGAPEADPGGVADSTVGAESLIHIEIDRQTSRRALLELETSLGRVLADVRVAVDDWKAMRQAAIGLYEELWSSPPPLVEEELEESREFLRWVYQDNFTFLGFLDVTLTHEDGASFLRPVPDTGLGLLRRLSLGERALLERPLSPEALRRLEEKPFVEVSKTISKSTIHRHVHMDLLAVKRYDEAGRVVGERRFLGLFTSMAYSIPASKIPLVRRKVARVIERTGFPPVSHNAKTLRHIVENYPRDELFQISEDDLYRFALRILELQLKPRLALLVRRDAEERFVFCMVYVPRDVHSTRLRYRIQEILERAFGGEVTDFYTRLSERPLAQLQFFVKTQPGKLPAYSVDAVEASLAAVARSWGDRLKRMLGADQGQQEALRMWRRYEEAFPSAYQEGYSAIEGAIDIPIIERVLAEGRLGMRLYHREGAIRSRFHFRTFELAVPAPLSEVLPRLENMGLRVATETPFEVRPADSSNPIWVRDFEVMSVEHEVEPDKVEENFNDAFARVWSGEVENDAFNKLVLRAGLNWRQVVVLRAYGRYLRQIGAAFSQHSMADALARHPEVVRLLLELFHTLLDPLASSLGGADEREARGAEVFQRVQEALEDVRSRDDDRILWRFANLILATLRTNYFQSGTGEGEPKAYLSLKFDGSRIRDLPAPRPMFEIFVYSPRMEAVHLRGGAVARGGIRWSDRREDFRTEILGLVKSQMVKNAVIVPVGAKGGFVLKQPPVDRDELLAEGRACYRTMIRGMLDLTDNLRGDEVVTPGDVVRRDGDDPYLVVAADKGTATFSDSANTLAREYDFWLGDAFASGGSLGYDHKKMGITARGAWESVKRHFRELGRDVEKEPFTCVGVGDMSGDVFGNGMLLSESTRLVAAFNHLHVFVDPDPDPVASYGERRRLFELSRSAWGDYRAECLSPGGAIFERSAKTVTLRPQAKEALGVSTAELTPDELIAAVLRAKVDLLWFGGIGTYVKAGSETNAEVGDWSNDTLRVNAGELGACVVGEGANLGLTQAARIEFALKGGRIHTDFIDNSGGVDCSDHEVNIKIVLDDAVAAGELGGEERDRLLAEMTGEVAELVLRDNYLQSQSIAITEFRAAELLEEHARLMRLLERAGLLDRRLEGLPDEDGLQERRQRKKGLTRPEIALLLAYSKIFVLGELFESGLPDEPLLVEDLVRYFPRPMQDRFRGAIERHRLRREIIATTVTNSLINRVGPAFVTRLVEDTGAWVSDVARAYTAARDVFALRSLWDDIEARDGQLPAELQNRMWVQSIQLVERATRWFLRYGGRPLDISRCVADYESDILTVAAQLPELLPHRARQRARDKMRRLKDRGVPEELAAQVAGLDIMPAACDVARCAREAGVAVEQMARIYFAVGERFGFDRLRHAAGRLGAKSPWQQAAVTANLEDLLSHQAEVARQVAQHPGKKAKESIASWREERAARVDEVDRLLGDFEGQTVDLAMLTIAERVLRRLAGD